MSDPVTQPKSGFFIWTKTGSAPRFCHPKIEGARAQAARLAKKSPGKNFLILQVIEKIGVDLQPLDERQVEGHRGPSPIFTAYEAAE